MEPSFYAVIPATVRYSKDVPDGAKLLYGEITSLCNKKGYCWATNEYFSGLYGCSTKTISRWISSLARAGFLLTIVDRDNANARKIWLPESQNINKGGGQKCPDPMDKNVPTYNRENNKENNIMKDKAGKPPKPKKTKSEKKENAPPPVIHRMVEIFEQEHQTHFKDSAGAWVGFTWQAKEFGALNSLKSEFAKRLQRRGAEFSDEAIVQGWQTFLQMAAKSDPFIVQKWFTPTKLWSNFQGIINSITAKNGKATSTNQQPSNAERQRAAFERIVRDAAENGPRKRTDFSAAFSDSVPNTGV